MKFRDKTWYFAAASGALLFLSFPKYGSGFIAWISLVPLLYTLKDRDVKRGAVAGFITGFLSYIGIIYWITYVVVHYGYLPYYMGISAMLLLSFYLSLYVAIFAAGVAYFGKKGVPQWLSAPVLWTILEYGKSHLLTGFPWENLGYSQYLNSSLIQIAEMTGVYGISFVIVLINALICCILIHWSNKKQVAVTAIAGILLLTVIHIYGHQRIEQIRTSLSRAASMEVTLVQGNIEQDIKWNPQYQKDTLDIYKGLSFKAQSPPLGLIVWPETATPFFFQDVNDMQREVVQVALSSGNWLIFGSPGYQKDEGRLSIYNQAYLLSPDGKVLDKYDKVHLVPFGEYVPLRSLLPFMSKLVVGVGDFMTGQGYYPLSAGDHRLGILICYEGILAEAGRMYKNRGADLLVNITNDAWFGRTSAPYQHLSMTTFRAIENRLYLVRAANTGISAIIDPTGEIKAQTELFEKAVLRGQVKFIDEKTFYGAYGNIFVYMNMLILLMIFLISMKKGRVSHV